MKPNMTNKKLLALALALIMALGVMPTAAFAAGDELITAAPVTVTLPDADDSTAAAPVINISPDANYEVTGTPSWSTAGSGELGDRFIGGRYYRLHFYLTPKSGYTMDSSTTCTVNGVTPGTVSWGTSSLYVCLQFQVEGTSYQSPTYTVSFDANGGAGTMAEITVTRGSGTTAPACIFTAPAGKEFQYWTPTNGARDTNKVTSLDSLAAYKESITLYAQWQRTAANRPVAADLAWDGWNVTWHNPAGVYQSKVDLYFSTDGTSYSNVSSANISNSDLQSRAKSYDWTSAINNNGVGYYYFEVTEEYERVEYSAEEKSPVLHVTSLTPPVSVSSIAVNSTDHKTAYKVGDSLDVTGLTIEVTKSDSSKETVPVTGSMVTGFDSSVAATGQTLTINYKGKTTTYTISVVAPTYIGSVTLDGSSMLPNLVAGGTPSVLTIPTDAPYEILIADVFGDGDIEAQGWSEATPGGTGFAESFEAGKTYHYELCLKPKEGESFDPAATLTITGISWKTSQSAVDPREGEETSGCLAFTGTYTVPEAATPTITGVTVNPAAVSVQKGNTQLFSATVTGTGSYDTTVDWSITGQSSTGTGIDATGKLTVAADETASPITVTATANGDTSKSATATVTVTEAPVPPTITGVTVNPAAVSVQKGNTQSFSATVTGTGSYDNTVSWSITGANSTGTTIDATGKLTVAANETASSITVKATANGDTSKSATATVTVTKKPVPPTPSPSGGSTGGGNSIGFIIPAQNTAQNANADVRMSGMNIPSGDSLITTPTQNGALMKLLGGNTLIGMWDIKLRSGRTSIPGSTLSFNVGRENAGKIFTLYHQKADGTVESFSATADAQGIVSFYPVGELSPFMLVQGGGITTTSILAVPATGAMSIGLALLLLSAIMAAAVLKRRKAQA